MISSTTNTTVSTHRERAERPELHCDRVQEDDLDVEQDEQHRHEVEADPEAEPALDVGRQTALVGLDLGAVGRPASDHQVQRREQQPDQRPQDEKDDRGQIIAQHGRTVISPLGRTL